MSTPTTRQGRKTPDNFFEGFHPLRCIIDKRASMDPNTALSQTLKKWAVAPPPTSEFRTAVWARIHSLRPLANETWSAYLRSHAGLWIFLGTLSVTSAVWAGHSAGETRLGKARERLVAHYVQSLDPMAALPDQP